MLTQEQCDEKEGGAEGRAGEAAKGEEEEEGGQGSTAATTPVDRIREPTSYTLVFLSGRQNFVMEVATGVAHPPSGLHHNNKIPPDYTRVEVHTVKPEFMQWRTDYATPEGLVLLGEVMGQFIL